MPWVPRGGQRAGCIAAGPFASAPHDSPSAYCECGFWALRPECRELPFNARSEDVRSGSLVFGRVKLWGRVMEYDQGWRAEYAAPASLFDLWAPDATEEMRRFARSHGVPVEPVPEAVGEALRRAVTATWLPTAITAPPSPDPEPSIRWWAISLPLVASVPRVWFGLELVTSGRWWGVLNLLLGVAAAAAGPARALKRRKR